MRFEVVRCEPQYRSAEILELLTCVLADLAKVEALQTVGTLAVIKGNLAEQSVRLARSTRTAEADLRWTVFFICLTAGGVKLELFMLRAIITNGEVVEGVDR